MNRQRITAALVLAVLVTACASMPPQRVALNTLESIRAAALAAVKTFNVGYQAGQFSEVQRTQLGILYGKYQKADTIAAEGIAAASAGTDYTQLVAGVTVFAGDLIKFVQSLKAGGPP